MINYLGLIDNSNSGDLGLAILLMFIITAITIAIPAALIGWVLYHLVKGSTNEKARSSKTKSKKHNLPPYLPYLVGSLGLLLILANISGTTSTERSIVFDTILLAIPFILALIASLSRIKNNTRKVLLAGVIYSALIFLAYHYWA